MALNRFQEKANTFLDQKPPEFDTRLAQPIQPQEEEGPGVGRQIFDALTAPAKRLGENIAELSEDTKNARAAIEQWRETDPEFAAELELMIGEKPTVKEVIGNVVGTVASAVPLPISKIGVLAKLSPLMRSGVVGAGYGGTFAVADAAGEDKNLKEMAQAFGIGVTAGGVTGPLGILVGRGFKRLATTQIFKNTYNTIADTTAMKTVSRFVRPVGSVLAKDFGEVGQDVVDRIMRADRNVQLTMGRVIHMGQQVRALGGAMTREQSYQMGRALRGLTPAPRQSTQLERGFVTGRIAGDTVEAGARQPLTITPKGTPADELLDVDAYSFFRSGFDDVAAESQVRGLRVKVPGRGGNKTEFVKFEPLENYYPQVLPDVNELRPAGARGFRAAVEKVTRTAPGTISKEGRLRSAVIRNAVDNGDFRSVEEATRVLDDWIALVDSDGAGITAQNGFVEYLIKSGQANNLQEARSLLRTIFDKQSLVKLGGSLENARIINNPFYNPYPDEVFPLYMADSLTRLENVAQLGVNYNGASADFPVIAKALDDVYNAQGSQAEQTFNKFLKVALNRMNNADDASKVSYALRMAQVPKLTFAQIVNVGQSVLNPLLATDARATFSGLIRAFRHKGVQQSLQSGATIQSIFNETVRATAGSGGFADKFLKATGFVWTEKFNRTVAANAGMNWSKRMFQKALQGGSRGEYYTRALQELGIDMTNALKRGRLTDNELLKAGQIMSEKTQFRSRPIDLPIFASHPMGKVFWQFKNFIYNQTLFVFRDNLAKQWNQGARGKARVARNLIVLSTVFPMVGEVLQDVRSLLTGSTRPTNALDRYLENLAGAGAWGIFLDMSRASKFDAWDEMIIGPAFGSVADLLNKVDDPEAFAREVARQTGVLKPISDIGRDKRDNPDRETFLETLQDIF